MFENVDASKLRRDYRKHPLKRGEKLFKEDFAYLFFDLDYTADEIAKYIGVSHTQIYRWKRLFGLYKPEEYRQSKIRATNLRKYGVSHNFNRPEVRKKRAETWERKYGCDNPLKHPDIQAKRKSTCNSRYGVDNPLQSAKIREKATQTVIQKYGVDNLFKSEEIKKKIKKTCLEKYGFNNAQQNPEIRRKAIETLIKTHGVASGMQLHVSHRDVWYTDANLINFVISGKEDGSKWTVVELGGYFNLTPSTIQVRIGELGLWKHIEQKVSKEEKEITELIKSWGFSVEKYHQGKWEFDVYVKAKNIAVEFNGNYWHSTRVNKDPRKQLKKTQYATSKGTFLYHIFEYEWANRKEQVINQLKNLLGINQTKIFARKCTIASVSKEEANIFLDLNHIQGKAAGRVRLGLFYNKQLVSLMTFAASRFNKNVQWELVRFCSKAGCNVVGGASKLFKHFVKTYNPESIVSYSDIAKTKGSMYDTLGFLHTEDAFPNYVWVHHADVLTRYQCQKWRLIQQGYGSLGNTEKEIMEKRNYAQVYDCGSRVHIWRR